MSFNNCYKLKVSKKGSSYVHSLQCYGWLKNKMASVHHVLIGCWDGGGCWMNVTLQGLIVYMIGVVWHMSPDKILVFTGRSVMTFLFYITRLKNAWIDQIYNMHLQTDGECSFHADIFSWFVYAMIEVYFSCANCCAREVSDCIAVGFRSRSSAVTSWTGEGADSCREAGGSWSGHHPDRGGRTSATGMKRTKLAF